MPERIQKVLAQAGLASRRQIEQWIKDGLIQVNGQTAELGQKIETSDKVLVRGKQVDLAASSMGFDRVIMYHKPEGEVCSKSDPEGRSTVYDHLPRLQQGRWISVGRLDINTSGLILFTNNGNLANKLMHPSSEVEREYACRVRGEITDEILKNVVEGVTLDDGPASFERVIDVDPDTNAYNHWFHVVLKEGRNREVRRIWESQDVQVSRLMRVRYGNIALPKALRQGRWIDIEERDAKELSTSVGVSLYMKRAKKGTDRAIHSRPPKTTRKDLKHRR